MTVAAGTAPGELTIPARLRYQACDETMCYFPTTAETGWTVRVVAAGAPVKAQHAEVFGGIAFGHGEAPKPAAPSISPEAAATPGVRSDAATREARRPGRTPR